MAKAMAQTSQSMRQEAERPRRFLTLGFALLPVLLCISVIGPRSLGAAVVHLLLASAALCASAVLCRRLTFSDRVRDLISLGVLALVPFPLVRDPSALRIGLAIGALAVAFFLAQFFLAQASVKAARGLALLSALAPFALALPYQLFFTR